MSLLRIEAAGLVFLVVEADVVGSGLAEQFVSLVHLQAEGAEDFLCVLRLLDYGVLLFLLFGAGVRQHREIVFQEFGVHGELHHLRVYEHEFQL